MAEQGAQIDVPNPALKQRIGGSVGVRRLVAHVREVLRERSGGERSRDAAAGCASHRGQLHFMRRDAPACVIGAELLRLAFAFRAPDVHRFHQKIDHSRRIRSR